MALCSRRFPLSLRLLRLEFFRLYCYFLRLYCFPLSLRLLRLEFFRL
jgi:hypothetical protein